MARWKTESPAALKGRIPCLFRIDGLQITLDNGGDAGVKTGGRHREVWCGSVAWETGVGLAETDRAGHHRPWMR